MLTHVERVTLVKSARSGVTDAAPFSSPMPWQQEHVELVDYVNSIAHRKVWLPDDFERAVRAVSEIERAGLALIATGDTAWNSTIFLRKRE